MKKLPKFLEKYFWDVDFDKIDLQKAKIFVLHRILDYGDEEAVHWMWRHSKRQELINILHNFRGFSQKSANFWALLLEVPKRQVLCLNKHSLKAPKAIWSY